LIYPLISFAAERRLTPNNGGGKKGSPSREGLFRFIYHINKIENHIMQEYTFFIHKNSCWRKAAMRKIIPQIKEP